MALLSVEGDEHVGRVTNLHSATLGYSAVIYGDMHGEDDMIDTWKVVWRNLKKDKHLPEKLVAFLNGLSAECSLRNKEKICFPVCVPDIMF